MPKNKYTKRNNKNHNQILPSTKQRKKTRGFQNIDSHESSTGLFKKLLTLLKNILHLSKMQEPAGNEVYCMNEQSPYETINNCINELRKQMDELAPYLNANNFKFNQITNIQGNVRSIISKYNNSCIANIMPHLDTSIIYNEINILNKHNLNNFIKDFIAELVNRRNDIKSSIQLDTTHTDQHYAIINSNKPTENNLSCQTGIRKQYSETEIKEILKQIDVYKANSDRLKSNYSQLENYCINMINKCYMLSLNNKVLEQDSIKYNEYLIRLQPDMIQTHLRLEYQGLLRPLKHIASGLIDIIDKIIEKDIEWLNKEIDKVISHVYTSPESVGLLSSYGQVDPFILYQIAILQKWAHDKLNELGIKIIYPVHGDSFNSSKHEFTDRDLVWITDDESLHNKIHSVITVGFENTAKQAIIRKARVKRYAYVPGDQSAPQPGESQHEQIETNSSEQDESDHVDSIPEKEMVTDNQVDIIDSVIVDEEIKLATNVDSIEQDNNSSQSDPSDLDHFTDEGSQSTDQEDEPSDADNDALRKSAIPEKTEGEECK